MARPLRIEFAGALYHVTARGNARGDIYRDDADRRRFLDILGQVAGRFGWRCPAWCQMSNHYHLVIETPEPNLGRGMRQLNGVYTQAVNRAHGSVGHVLQGRYKAILVDREAYLLELCRYVVLNPVRAGMVHEPRRWQWSSYRATAGETAAPAWQDADGLLSHFGRTRPRARERYAAFVADGIGCPSIWQDLKQQIYLGSESFAGDMRGRLPADADFSEVPAAQHKTPPPPLAEIAATCPDRGEAMARAYLSGGYSQAAIARHFGVHYSTVSRAVRRWERSGA